MSRFHGAFTQQMDDFSVNTVKCTHSICAQQRKSLNSKARLSRLTICLCTFCFPSPGCPVQESHTDCKNLFKAFQGCMRLLTLDNQTVDLIEVQQRLLGNYSHLQIDMCGITDRFVSQSRFLLKKKKMF